MRYCDEMLSLFTTRRIVSAKIPEHDSWRTFEE